MGAIKSELKRLFHPYDDEEVDEYDEDDSFIGMSERPSRGAERRERSSSKRMDDTGSAFFSDGARSRESGSGKVVSIHTTAQLQVALLVPREYESARDIADHLLQKHAVVLNLENVKKAEDSRRILDFLAGVAYAQQGQIKPVAGKTYIVTPYNVELLGDLLDELENNGLF